MKRNMGSPDKLVRGIAALIIIGLYFSGIVTGTAGIVLLVLSAVLILTSLVGFCPLYTLFGINTCSRDKSVS